MDFNTLEQNLQQNKDVDKKAFCELIFPQVSRTFAVNVVRLPQPLQFHVLVAYLLCRIADTIEDNAKLPAQRKKELLDDFAKLVTEEQWSTMYGDFEKQCRDEVLGEEVDITLLHHSKYVLQCFWEFPKTVRDNIRKWVQEMAHGMGEYATRKQTSTVTFLQSVDDLEKYCYYVAGTVGHLLNGLFAHHYSCISSKKYAFMEKKATSFGLGLQLTNIIKDSIVDYQRGWCYLPGDLLQELSLTDGRLLDNSCRGNAYKLMHTIIQRAKEHLDNALLYSCALPKRAMKVRVFCFLPLMMAIKTLEQAAANEQLFDKDNPVKISRGDVLDIVKYTRLNVWSNFRMIRWYKRVEKSLTTKLAKNCL
ncbi:phytoene/squalene synthase family protein [Candidatus Uabimicrobium amorphum]|uniref:Farnesyl-diphosphate farnesyltransferase n=1 Tax=Uabimicrobium amorphum TaxID=2596890 RepID=A0A5S9F7Z7_UABAM|nr:phytoene/squalene synthase family protein [Candidatus Uabimicrobium amorphum]BBM88269.1 farnesyl-diphosphate farnesyltransferase [Candidatus Uabimicrobium amorphum]